MAAFAHVFIARPSAPAGAERGVNREALSRSETPSMKCPICEQVVVKSGRTQPGTLWIRCITDGDFTVAPDATPLLADLPLAKRQLVLNAAIIDRQPEALPFIGDAFVLKGCIKAEEIAL